MSSERAPPQSDTIDTKNMTRDPPQNDAPNITKSHTYDNQELNFIEIHHI